MESITADTADKACHQQTFIRWGWTKWPTFFRWYFQMHLLRRKLLYFDWNVTEICSLGPNLQEMSTDPGNRSLSVQWTAITWTNFALVSPRICKIYFNELWIKLWYSFIEENAFENVIYKISKCSAPNVLTHWDRVRHICVSKLTVIGSDNGLAPNQHQAIIWTNAGILFVRPLSTNFSEISIDIHIQCSIFTPVRRPEAGNFTVGPATSKTCRPCWLATLIPPIIIRIVCHC